MRVYVAAKFEEKVRVRAVYEELQRLGHEITVDWTVADDTSLLDSPGPLAAYRRQCVEQDVDGVRLAPAMILLVRDDCLGAFVELGVALHANNAVFAVAPLESRFRRSVFAYHRNVYLFETDRAAISALEHYSNLERTELTRGLMTIKELQERVHKTAVEHGWWWDQGEVEARIAEKIALMHSELSEALEEYRAGRMAIWYAQDWPVDQPAKPEGFGIELADTVIRILDLCAALGMDFEECLSLKAAYNETRPYRHGGKKV